MAEVAVDKTVRFTNKSGDKNLAFRGATTGKVIRGPRGQQQNLWYIDMDGQVIWAYTNELEVQDD